MRLLNFLNKAEDTLEDVKRDCSKFLDEWKIAGKNKALYRAVKDDIGVLKKFKSLKFRMPRDTTYSATQWLDNFYTQKLGIPLRTTSVFTTSDYSSASAYGTVYYCIPVNGYSIYCNPKIRDVFTDVFSPYGTMANFSKSKQIFSAFSVMISAKTNYKPDPKWGSILRKTASTFLCPTVAVFSDAERINLLKAYKPWAYLNGKYIFEENLQEAITVPGDKISAEKAYEIFWKPCFDELLIRMKSLFSETKRMPLAEASGTKNEVMVQCISYYLVTSDTMNQLWK